ncbi:MAG TPA: hypothetical protein VF316_23380 [Polyangiaceae bacterium]
MSRKLSSRLLMLAGLVSVTAVAACSSTAATDTAATSQAQALAEAQSSYDAVKQSAEVCWTAAGPIGVFMQAARGRAKAKARMRRMPATYAGGVGWPSFRPKERRSVRGPTTPSPCRQAKGVFAPVIQCFIDGLDHAAWSEEAKVVWTFFASLP